MTLRQAGLRAIGFLEPGHPERPGETNYWITLEQREADRAAAMMVRALREVFAVLHPVYLEADGLPTGEVEPPAPSGSPPDHPFMPGDAAELRAGIDHVVRDLCEPPPEWDEDGELPLETEHSTLWVSLAPTAPRMLLHATLVEDVADERRALIETNLLNRQQVGLTFLVVEETIRVARELDASVLVPDMLRLEVGRLLEQIDTWASELVARVGGRRPDDTTPRPAPGQGAGADQSRFDTAYSVLEELEEQERGSVGPATMARVFQQDTGLLLKAIRKTEEKIDYWRLREQQWGRQ